MPIRVRAVLSLVFAVACVSDTQSEVVARSEALREGSFSFEVSLRETGSATIHATVFAQNLPSRGATVLAVPGLAESGRVFEPLARAIFTSRTLRRQIGRVVAIDLVGRGDSSLPRALPLDAKFGELTLEDNVSVVLQAIRALRAQGRAPRLLLAHSMGGLAVQAAQQALLREGSSLAQQGIVEVMLLAPVPPHARPWQMGPQADLMPFIQQSQERGSYLALTPEAFIAQAYGTPSGELASDAPTPQQVEAAGYVAPEPLVTVLQLVEAPIPLPDGRMLELPRPSVDAGAFGPEHGTRLTLFSFSRDVLVPAPSLEDLYGHLTGEPSAVGYREITAADAVHNTFTSHPELITAELVR